MWVDAPLRLRAIGTPHGLHSLGARVLCSWTSFFAALAGTASRLGRATARTGTAALRAGRAAVAARPGRQTVLHAACIAPRVVERSTNTFYQASSAQAAPCWCAGPPLPALLCQHRRRRPLMHEAYGCPSLQ